MQFRWIPYIAVPLLAVAATQGALHAQGRLVGVVVEARTAKPVADAVVRILTLSEERVTDRDGRFRFTELQSGNFVLETRHLGYTTRTDTVALVGETEMRLHIQLVAGAIELPPITVETVARRLAEAGFFRRRDRGNGTFLTREQIQQHRVDMLGDLFSRVPGLRRTMMADGSSRINSRGGTIMSRCDIQYVIDGVFVELDRAGIDGIPVHVIEGIEVYRGSSQVPSEFDSGRAMCGAVVIWTRGG